MLNDLPPRAASDSSSPSASSGGMGENKSSDLVLGKSFATYLLCEKAFVQPIDQTVFQGVDRRGYHCARELDEKVRVVEVEEAGSRATMAAHET